ncbi:MAG TPA: MoxR family ATPase [Ignavibacteriaceae bacterium]|jgi:MoxR-like ATPase|nr:MAG: Holliday junction DNA helicase RuvB [Ignavibacteria bacterium ADurb.Bin266]OQY75287.1 MAG: magnesium chelatase [Ignavibacteriales bacterium UTCHB2]HQF42111.1 MoxR family ATPase [Ignavibacteriaceae bacterium]HQI42145.1 MoxR family ATPase [Ignavibacteriaceae bacterium]
MENNSTSRTDLTELQNSIEKVKTEIKKIIVGQDKTIELFLAAIFADGHVLIEGVPGIAKTLIAKILAKTISADFSRIQFTPDLMPSDILGTSIYNMKLSEFEFKKGPIFSNIILIDEINRSPAKTQAALFEVMEERQITIDGITYKMNKPFIVFATQNPIEHEGTYKLPEAQLDRFLFKIEMHYPELQEEIKILLEFNDRKSHNDLNQISQIFTKTDLENFRTIIRAIHIEEKIASYIAGIVNQTRKSGDLYLGASPRASIAIMMGAKSLAAIRGRDFVIPDDVKEIVFPALRHRIILTAEKEMEGKTPDEILQTILNRVEVPR